MSGPRIVTPQEAERLVGTLRTAAAAAGCAYEGAVYRYAHTVATEPERIAAAERAAVVKALRQCKAEWGDPGEWADVIENGAPL